MVLASTVSLNSELWSLPCLPCSGIIWQYAPQQHTLIALIKASTVDDKVTMAEHVAKLLINNTRTYTYLEVQEAFGSVSHHMQKWKLASILMTKLASHLYIKHVTEVFF